MLRGVSRSKHIEESNPIEMKINLIARLSYPLKQFGATYRLCSLLSAHYRELVPSSSTSLAIEGFPRSGNSFLYEALKLKLPGHVRVAQHVHHLGNVKLCLAARLPTAILLRDPKSAILSSVLSLQCEDLDYLCRWYHKFYSWIYDHRDAVKIVRSEDLFNDPVNTIADVLEFAGFGASELTSLEINEVRAKLDQFNTKMHQGDPLRVSYPTSEKEAAKARMEAELLACRHFASAVAAYERVVNP